MEVVGTIEHVRRLVGRARRGGKKVGFVPTMGALHIGHESLINRAVGECGFVVVSIFVNPTQFGPTEDFEAYPRPLQADLELCDRAGVHLVFNPSAREMYGQANLTWVIVEKLTGGLCGASRPAHFRGVTTVCAKLFNIVQPDIAYFGQKDAQQAVVIKRMVADLNMPLDIVVCPTVRERDGLAVSSRNQYLSPQQRRDAAGIYRALQKCKQLVEAGTTDTARIICQMREILARIPGGQTEYVSIVDAESLEPVDTIEARALAAVALKLGPARLIDNIIIEPPLPPTPPGRTQ